MQDTGWVPGNFYLNSYAGSFEKYKNTLITQEGQEEKSGKFIEYNDPDTKVVGYDETTDRTISNGLTVIASGTDDNGQFVEGGKDLHGVFSRSLAKTTKWASRGVSAFAGSAHQYGSGVATNEFFAIQEPDSVDKASQLVGVIAAVSPNYADCGNSPYNAIEAANVGIKDAHTCFKGYGNFKIGLDLTGIPIKYAGILMSRTTQGSIIDYDTNCYTYYAGKSYRFVIDGVQVASISKNPVNDSDVVTIGFLREKGLI